MNNPTVLYAEDDLNDVYFMRFGFDQAELRNPLQIASTGQEAIDYLAGNGPFADRDKHPLPGLVLLDLNLPIIPGFAVLRWIREQPQYQELPVVICSASDYEADKEAARQLGAQDYLVKTSDIMALPSLLRNITERWLA